MKNILRKTFNVVTFPFQVVGAIGVIIFTFFRKSASGDSPI